MKFLKILFQFSRGYIDEFHKSLKKDSLSDLKTYIFWNFFNLTFL